MKTCSSYMRYMMLPQIMFMIIRSSGHVHHHHQVTFVIIIRSYSSGHVRHHHQIIFIRSCSSS
jgi:hypothetical protein